MKYLKSSLFVMLLTALIAHDASGVSVRFACFGLGKEPKDFEVFLSPEESIEVSVPRVGFSQPVNVNTRRLSIDANELLADGVLSEEAIPIGINLPDEGGAFIVLLIDLEQQGIRPLVIPSDTQRFKEGDLLFFNLTDSKVGVVLGEEKLILEPYSKKVKTPPSLQTDSNYQVQFFVDKNGRVKLFSATRWQYQPGVRGYIFILQDPSTGRHYYEAMGEFVDNRPVVEKE